MKSLIDSLFTLVYVPHSLKMKKEMIRTHPHGLDYDLWSEDPDQGNTALESTILLANSKNKIYSVY